jgi:putative flippase GtrA
MLKKRLLEFLKFGTIGALMTVLSLGLYAVFNEWCQFNYLVSNIISYAIAVVLSYFLNARFAFEVKIEGKKENLLRLFRFSVMKLMFLVADSGLLFVLVNLLNVDKYWSKIFTTIILTALSYFVTRKIIAKE